MPVERLKLRCRKQMCKGALKTDVRGSHCTSQHSAAFRCSVFASVMVVALPCCGGGGACLEEAVYRF